ncbi:MAG: hypothetical protein HRF49_09105 [bacterium]|jgi:hypothetical protein
MVVVVLSFVLVNALFASLGGCDKDGRLSSGASQTPSDRAEGMQIPPGPEETPDRSVSNAPDFAEDAVFDFDQIGNRSISWGEVMRGDGNRDGVVNSGDGGPLQDFNGDKIAGGSPSWPMKDPVDYDDDDEIEYGYQDGDYEVWTDAWTAWHAIDGYKVYLRYSYLGQVIHTVTVPGPSYAMRTSKFLYDENSEPDPENPLLYKPSGYYWTENGAVGYVCTLTYDDSQSWIDEGTWYISVAPYDGQDVGTESSRWQTTLADSDPLGDTLRIECLDTTIKGGETARIQIWITENEADLFHMPACRVRITQDTGSDAIDWDSVTYSDFSATNPLPFCQELYDQGCDFAAGAITWTPPLRDQADERTADMPFIFGTPDPSYGVSEGTIGYFGYIDIPTNAVDEEVQFTVFLEGLDPTPPYEPKCWYLYSNSSQDIEYFDTVSATGIEVSVEAD